MFTHVEVNRINGRFFRWHSPSTISAESPTVRRYINHRAQGYQPWLFVRSSKSLFKGLTTPFQHLGPAE
jgi:hypothetical protein